MPWLRVLVLLLCLPLSAQDKAPVLVLSFDGLAADRFTARSMPRVWTLARKGWRGRGLPPFPSTTFNGHATLATGCWPEHHGIVANGFLDPTLGPQPYAARAELLQREPLWVAATRAGLKSAVYHWPCATGPWEGVATEPMTAWQESHRDEEAMAFVDQALDGGAKLVMAYFSGIDAEGHHEGPTSPEVWAKLRAIDAVMGPWLARHLAARPGLRVVLVADHGMTAMHRLIRLPEVLKGLDAAFLAHGGSAYVYAKSGETRQEAARRLEAHGLRVWPRAALPAAYHLGANPRTGDLVVLAPEGTWLSQLTGEAFLDEAKGRAGAHAYGPERRSMHTWLVVLGAGRGRLGEVPLWDIAPTVADWMGIRWAQEPDGKPIPALRVPRR